MNLIKWIIFIVLAIISMAYIYHFDEASITIIACFAAIGYALYEVKKSVSSNHQIFMQKLIEIEDLLRNQQQSEKRK